MLIHANWSVRQVIKFTWKTSVLVLLVTGLTTLVYLLWLQLYFAVPPFIIGVMGTAIAFFIGFINNEAYGRWWEARQIWGALLNDSRSWSRSVLTYSDHSDPTVQHRMVRRHLAFLNALAALLRRTGDTHYETFLTSDDRERVRSFVSIPTAILRLQAEDIHQLHRTGQIDGFLFQRLDWLLEQFTTSMGQAERIKNTVFPTSYVYFTRLFIWIFIILCSIIAAETLNYWSAVLTWLIGFVYLITYQNGQLLMNPFDNEPSGTPISSIVRSIEINLLQDLGEVNIPEPVAPVNDDYLM